MARWESSVTGKSKALRRQTLQRDAFAGAQAIADICRSDCIVQLGQRISVWRPVTGWQESS